MNFKSYIPFYKNNLAIAVPVMLSQLGQVVVQMADTMMVGRLGAVELAAVSFANAVFNVGLLFSMGTALGLTPLIGKAYAEKKEQESVSLFQNSFVLNLIFAFLVGGVMFGISFFMNSMGQTERVAELAIPYFHVMVLSMFPLMIFLSFKQFMEGIGNTRTAMMITIFANLVNIVLNYLWINGKMGFQEYGVVGAAYATLVSRILMPVLFFAVFLYKKSLRHYFSLFSYNIFSAKKMLQVAKVGLPIGTQIFVEQMAFSFTAVMVGWLGAIALASHQIAMNMSYMIFMILSGLSAGTTIRVSHQLGVKAYGDLRKAAFASFHLTLGTVILAAAVMIIFRNQLPMIFTSDPEVIAMSGQLLIICAIYQIPDGLQVVSLGALRGISDVKRPMLYAMVSYILINIPVGYFCGFVLNMGTIGIWMGFVFGLTTASVLFISRFNRMSNKFIQEAEEENEDLERLSA
ncbi:MAG: MATE family efflux transporter [Bacteroidales bacterium]